VNNYYPLALFLSVAAVALFSFLSVAVWSAARRQERETYYKTETAKKIAESQEPGAALALDYLRSEEKSVDTRLGNDIRLGGLVAIAVGISLGVFFWAIVPERGVYLLGLIPLSAGIALIVYSSIRVVRN